MKIERSLLAYFAFALLLAWAFAPRAQAQDKDCLACHAKLARQKVVHAAVEMGCGTCHAALDASVVPHRSPGNAPKGLLAEPPGLCGKCHEAALFQGNVVHAPVGSGQCLRCHAPHASANAGLLNSPPAKLCLDCHPEIAKAPHVVAGFTRSGHPIGNENKVVPDPLRPGRIYYCAACHEPHRSRFAKLTRSSETGMVACQKCHKV